MTLVANARRSSQENRPRISRMARIRNVAREHSNPRFIRAIREIRGSMFDLFFNELMEYQDLLSTILQIGQVRWIGVRPARVQPLTVVNHVEVDERGLSGDRFDGGTSKCQVTLIQLASQASPEFWIGRISIQACCAATSSCRESICNHSKTNIFKSVRRPVRHRRLRSLLTDEENLGPGGSTPCVGMEDHGSRAPNGTIRVGDRVAVCLAADLSPAD
jgi:hypothetical protein